MAQGQCYRCGGPFPSTFRYCLMGTLAAKPCSLSPNITPIESDTMSQTPPVPKPTPKPTPKPVPLNALNTLRDAGWVVAVHNDYTVAGVAATFWLLTRGDKFIKGEGPSDAAALRRALNQAKAIDATITKVLVPSVKEAWAEYSNNIHTGPGMGKDQMAMLLEYMAAKSQVVYVSPAEDWPDDDDDNW